MAAKRLGMLLWMVACFAGLFVPAGGVSAEEGKAMIKSDADTAAQLGLLQGDGDGVNAGYLAKTSTRLQAAIISLRLQGVLQEALTYSGTGNFSDAKLVSAENKNLLAYLKNHPERGWSGVSDDLFDPLSEISSRQLYKVLLEVLGYRSGADFSYADTETFAASKGLKQIAGTPKLTNAHIATALIEGLSAASAKGGTLFAELQMKKVIATDAGLPSGERITLQGDGKLGAYFADKAGRTLYFFTKDAENLEACQGKCIDNWPVYYTDHLQIPAQLNAADFSSFTRKDGTKQLTYKGWPLYYFIKDTASGDVKGEAVGGVWFVAKPDYAVMLGTSSTLGNYLTDAYGRTLYYFDKDTAQMSMCEGKCLANWPAYSASGTGTPTGVAASDLGTITRTDGSQQSTYKGYPLYYFVKDQVHGAASGQDVNHVWFVIDPAKFDGTTAAKAAGPAGMPGGAAEPPTPSDTKTYQVGIKEFSFGTEPLTVEAGSKVTFTNMDNVKHNAVAEDGSFHTPLLANGESYTITLDKPGTYDYFCEPHKSFMTGRIIVK